MIDTPAPAPERWQRQTPRAVPLEAGIAIITYYRGTTEGMHEVRLEATRLQVRPDGRTTARQRSQLINEALAELQGADLPASAVLELIVGRLFLAGATHLEVISQ